MGPVEGFLYQSLYCISVRFLGFRTHKGRPKPDRSIQICSVFQSAQAKKVVSKILLKSRLMCVNKLTSGTADGTTKKVRLMPDFGTICHTYGLQLNSSQIVSFVVFKPFLFNYRSLIRARPGRNRTDFTLRNDHLQTVTRPPSLYGQCAPQLFHPIAEEFVALSIFH